MYHPLDKVFACTDRAVLASPRYLTADTTCFDNIIDDAKGALVIIKRGLVAERDVVDDVEGDELRLRQ